MNLEFQQNRPAVSDDAASEAQALRVERVRLLYTQAHGGFVVTLLNAALLVVGLWKVVGHSLLMGWLAFMIAITVGRYALVRAYCRCPDQSRAVERWEHWYVVGAASAGLGWGMAGTILFPVNAMFHQAMIAFLIGGMVAGALPFLASSMRAYLAFMFPSVLPFATVLFMQAEQVHHLMGAMVLVFAGAMWAAASMIGHAITRSLQLRFKNTQLVEGLAAAAAKVARTSSELEVEIGERKRAQADLRREQERAHITLESIGEGVIATDAAGVIEYLNPVAEQLTGWSIDVARGLPLRKVLKLVDETTGRAVADPVQRCLQERRSFHLSGHTLLVRRDEDRDFSIEVAVSPIFDRGRENVGVVLVFHDVTEIRGVARRMSYQASHDSLTGLVNRLEFELRLTRALESARNEGRIHAMCYLDLDQFKRVNDSCGHIAGDELLKQLAVALQAGVRESDTLARLGGDEFGVLLEGCPLEKAKKIADGLRQVVQGFRFAWQDHVFEIGVSIGLVAINEDSGSLTEVMSAADSACYMAKDYGRHQIHVYKPDDKFIAKRHGELQWVERIAQALDEDRIHLYRQPALPLSQKAQQRGYAELLIRMHSENGSVIATSAFLPAAKRHNLMPTVDRWVIRKFCAFMSDRQIPGSGDIVAVNLSGQSLSDECFLDFVVDQLDRYAVVPQNICFEITETAAIANLTRAMHFISVLKDMGANFALDDFGSGLSSFAYLKNLKVDFLKIDGSFIRDTVDDPVDYAMVEIINQIGHVMNIRTIAESVEQQTVLTKLRELGVDYAQGFTIARPVPPEEADTDAVQRRVSNSQQNVAP